MHARLTVASLIFASAASAVPGPPRPEHEVTSQQLVYQLPGMDRVVIRKDIPYKKTDAGELKLDLYYPPDFHEGTSRPAVVFINGVGDGRGGKLKDWGVYQSWGRLIAASGWIGVTFESRGPYTASGPDIADAFGFFRKDGARLGIDAARVAAWACSGNVPSGLRVLMENTDPGLLGAVVYYGYSDLPKIRGDFPVYYVRAGRDSPELNASIESLWARSVAAGAPWTMVNAPRLHHGFDVLDETEEARRIVRETLDFYRDLFAPPAAPGPASAAKKALSHWFGGREYPEAAAAYAEYVEAHPDDAEAWLRLGLSQAHTGARAQAGASLTKAAALGADRPVDLYNIACGYALAGETGKALNFLERAVAAGFNDRRLMESDEDLANVRGTEGFKKIVAKLP